MSDGLTLNIVDMVTGHCPRCPSPDIALEFVTGTASGTKYKHQTYALRCRHAQMCRWLSEYRDLRETEGK